MTNDPVSPPNQTPETTLHLDEDGLPILQDVLETPPLDEFAAALKVQLLTELQPQLRSMVEKAMTESIKAGALELKRSFEHQLATELKMQLQDLVELAVERACRKAE